jgi:hypothetical protein
MRTFFFFDNVQQLFKKPVDPSAHTSPSLPLGCVYLWKKGCPTAEHDRVNGGCLHSWVIGWIGLISGKKVRSKIFLKKST